jgi:MFS family permease
MELTFPQFYLYLFLGQIVVGILLGLIPLFMGRARGESRLGTYGFIATIVGCALSPLIGLIVLGVSLWMITKKKNRTSLDADGSDSVH